MKGHDMDGDLERAGDQWKLRFTRELPHPAEKVWQAVTEPRHLEAWFPQRIVGEWAVGAPLTFEARGGEHPPFDGEVLAWDPPSLLEFRWGTDVIRFEIKPHENGAAGGCTFVLTDAFDELGKAARDSAGWHTCLDYLAHHLNGTTPAWAAGPSTGYGDDSARRHWSEVHAGYVEKFGEAASAIGPPV
jgi:uncharacterized protein YndB with AHSA1/START domain